MRSENPMKALYLTVAAAFLVSAACNKPKEAPAVDSPSGMPMDRAGMRGMTTDSGQMRGIPGMGSAGMMPMMKAQMDSMMRMKPDQMSGMMATHERMMSQMMDQMGGQMRQMRMSATPGWSALMDSVKQDLAELPGLKGQALSTRMRAHADRARRLMTMHQQMMNSAR
jgi:hypothetical protein